MEINALAYIFHEDRNKYVNLQLGRNEEGVLVWKVLGDPTIASIYEDQMKKFRRISLKKWRALSKEECCLFIEKVAKKLSVPFLGEYFEYQNNEMPFEESQFYGAVRPSN